MCMGRNLTRQAEADARRAQAYVLHAEQEKARFIEQQKAIKRFEALSDTEIVEFLTRLEQIVKNTVNPAYLNDKQKNGYLEVLGSLDTLKRIVVNLDWSLISEENKASVATYMLFTVPGEVSRIKNGALQYGYDVFNNGPGKLNLGYLTRYLRDAIPRQILTFEETVKSVTTVFPTFETQDTILLASLDRLRKLWEQAKEGHLETEDAQFLILLVDDLLPNYWRMYEVFESAPIENREAAERILLEQFALLENQLMRIVQKRLSHAIASIQESNTELQAKFNAVQFEQSALLDTQL
jgi:hypothetical protein